MSIEFFRPDHPLPPENPAASITRCWLLSFCLMHAEAGRACGESGRGHSSPAMARSDSPTLFDLPLKPDFSVELKLIASGCRAVAGTDEAGRGPLAGPVVAAAVILDHSAIPSGLDDSKRMDRRARETAFDLILKQARALALCSMPAEAIDQTDIRKASLEAMRKAVASLAIPADHVLADGRDVPPGLSYPGTALIKGDQRSVSIAAASIVAKVMRDRMMALAGSQHPEFGFDAHAGYGTARHIKALEATGPVPRLHRFSFAPIKVR